MAFSHRDHRARRELRRLYVIFGVTVGALTAVALAIPYTTVRLLAVVGLAATGVVYLLSVDHLTGKYAQDLASVRSGTASSGELRAEVFHEVGFERGRYSDWSPSPNRRPPEPGENPASPMEPERSDPPSAGP